MRVEDGWEYFIYGWTCVMEEVFDMRFTAADIRKLSEAAGSRAHPCPQMPRARCSRPLVPVGRRAVEAWSGPAAGPLS